MYHTEYPEDIDRIRRLAWAHGWDVSAYEAAQLWRMHSDDYAASWLILPTTDEKLWTALESLINDLPNRVKASMPMIHWDWEPRS